MSTISSIAKPGIIEVREAGALQGTVLMLGSSLTIVGAVMIAPMLPKLAAEFAQGGRAASVLVPLIATGPAFAIAVCAPFAGWLADKVGRKLLLVLATLVYALTGAAPALLNDLHVILLTRLLFGVAEACVMTCCTTLIGDYWTGEKRVRYINRQTVVIGVVGTLFFIVGGAVGEHSWRYPFYLYLLSVLFVPAMAVFLWEPVRGSSTSEEEGLQAAQPVSSLTATVAVAYVLVFAGMIFTFVAAVEVPGLMVDIGVSSSTLIGLSTGCGLLATLCGSATWSRLLKYIGPRLVNALMLAMLGTGLYLLAHAHSVGAVQLAVIIHGTGAGLLVPNAMLPLMQRLPPASRGRGLGGFMAALYLGQFVSPLVVAMGAGQAGGIRATIVDISTVAFLAVLVWVFYDMRKRLRLA